MRNRDTTRPTVVDIDAAAERLESQLQVVTPVIHSGTVPGASLSSYRVIMAPAQLTLAHLHRHTDLIVFVVRGTAVTLWGEDMEAMWHGVGEEIYIPAGVPHAAYNPSQRDSLVAVEVRTDPHCNEDVELLPRLQDLAIRTARELPPRACE